MEATGGKITAYRLEHANQIRQFKTELLHLVQKAARTWYNQSIEGEKADATLEMFSQLVAGAKTYIALAVDENFKACGYIFGVAAPEREAFALHSFYAKEEVLADAFKEMFDALDRYCYRAGIKTMEFRIIGELPYSNPRMQAFLRRFKPNTLLECNLDNQDVNAFILQPEKAQAPIPSAAGSAGHGEQGDITA
jgi:hypothetical protein